MVLHKTHHQEEFLNLRKDKWYGILIERMLQYPVSHFRQNLRVSLRTEAGGRETPEEKRQSFDELRKRRSDLGVNICWLQHIPKHVGTLPTPQACSVGYVISAYFVPS